MSHDAKSCPSCKQADEEHRFFTEEVVATTEELRRILKLGQNFPVAKKKKDGFEFDLGSEGNLSYQQLVELGELFGTTHIDVNSYMEQGGGCETCAYESANLTIQVYGATKNLPTFYGKHKLATWEKV